MKIKISIHDWTGGLIGAGLAVGVGLALHVFALGQSLIRLSYDLPIAFRENLQPSEAVIVYMDDESHEKLKQPFDSRWDRSLHAKLIDRLTDAGARAVVFDIIFSDPDPIPGHDVALAAAIKKSGKVVLGADTVPAGYGVNQVNMRIVTPPTDALRSPAAGIGSAEIMPAQDLIVRRHFHGSPDDALSSLSWTAAALAGAAVTGKDESRFTERWLNYYGPPGIVPNTSYHRALDTNATPASLFRNKVVFVGARLFTVFAGQRKDEYRSPYSYWGARSQFMPGIEIQATMFLNLFRGDWLTRWSSGVERWVLVLFGAVFGFVLVQSRVWLATSLAAAAIVGVSAAALLMSSQYLVWFPWLLVVTQIVLALLFAIALNSARLFLQKRILEHSLSLHLAPSRVRQITSNPEILKPGADKQVVSILFSDIADFTKISEGMDSDSLAWLMNSYFEVAISRIHDTDGMVVKLIGDAIFAMWNAPLLQPDHQERACRAALLLRDQVEKFVGSPDTPPLKTRIGLHTGVANVGNFGSATRFDYTAIGENINLASRMEGLNKFLGTRVLATHETVAALDGKFDMRKVGHFRLKGFKKAVAVFELLGPMEQAEQTKPWRETFAAGLDHYERRNLTEASEAFHRTLELHPDDGPALFYLGQILEMPPDWMIEKWTGEVQLKEK